MNFSSIDIINVVNVAKTWIGTPFHPQATVRMVGCDCLGLIIGIATELDISSILDGKLIALHYRKNYCYNYKRDSLYLSSALSYHFSNVEFQKQKYEEILPGHIVLFQFNKMHYHLGIVIDKEYQLFSENVEKFPANIPNIPCTIKEKDNDKNDVRLKKIKIIHSCFSAGEVVERQIDFQWIRRIHKVFSFS